MQARRFPDARVLVSAGLPRENQLPKIALGQAKGAIDISGLVTRIRTTTSLVQPNATFEIGCTFEGLQRAIPELAEKRSLNRVLVPENIVSISFDAGVTGSTMTEQLQGTITRVSECTAIGEGGQPMREIVLSGESWGKLLVRHEIPAHLFTAFLQGQEELVYREDKGAMLGGPVGTICQRLFDAVFVSPLQPLQLHLKDLFVIDIDQSLFEAAAGVLELDSVWTLNGRFWNALRGLADEPWNELFAYYDPAWVPQGPGDGLRVILPEPTATGAPAARPAFVIRLRRRPLDKERWKALPTIEIRDEEIVRPEVALSDHERVNWVIVEPSSLLRATAEEHLDYIDYQSQRFDQEDAERHCAHLLKRTTCYVDEEVLEDPAEHARLAAGTGVTYTRLDDRARRLWEWNAINHRLWSGVWVVAGRTDVRPGFRVRNQREASAYFVKEESERRDYYVEQMIQDFRVIGRRFFTHLAITRGQPVDGFLEPWVDGLPGSRSTEPVDWVIERGPATPQTSWEIVRGTATPTGTGGGS